MGRFSTCGTTARHAKGRDWVADERRRIEAATAQGQTPLTPAERDELARLRKQVAEQEKDIAFLKKKRNHILQLEALGYTVTLTLTPAA